MVAVATLHIRNVPDDVVERLKARAAGNGRSLNAEVVACLTQSTASWRGDPVWWATFEADRRQMRAAIEAGAPQPEELIRELRDSR